MNSIFFSGKPFFPGCSKGKKVDFTYRSDMKFAQNI